MGLMSRLPAYRGCNALLVLAAFASLLGALPARGQQTTPPAPAPSNPPTGTGPGRQSAPQSMNQFQVPLNIYGRVLSETGQPTEEAPSVELHCGMKSLQAVHTDLKGYFNFNMGSGAQSNADYSAANDLAILAPDGTMLSAPGAQNVPSEVLSGCELRVFVSGYRPLAYTMHGRADLGRVDVGTLMLSRIAVGQGGPSVSVTSLLVPNGARKEFDRGEKDVTNKDLKSAAQHLEKAVAEYARYSAAWNELGRIYFMNNEVEKARPAFEKAIAADPAFAPPYINLANLELQTRQDESAVANAGKALEIEPNNSFARLLEAMGNFNLNRLDEAEKSALTVEKAPHPAFPQMHALLANIYLRRQDRTHAAEQMRGYLKEAPQGEFAEQMKINLDQIEKSEAADGTLEGQPKTAP